MSLLSNIIGFSLVGLAARFGQLGIQKQNLFMNPGGHLLSMGVFGYAGYWVYKWEIRSNELLAAKHQEILERRQKQIQKTQQQEAALAES